MDWKHSLMKNIFNMCNQQEYFEKMIINSGDNLGRSYVPSGPKYVLNIRSI